MQRIIDLNLVIMINQSLCRFIKLPGKCSVEQDGVKDGQGDPGGDDPDEAGGEELP
jgi:hypothetical protein